MVTKGAPQDSILGPVFSICLLMYWMQALNSPLSILLMILKWEVLLIKGQEALRRALARLEHWVMIKFNKSKCWVLHLGQSYTGYKYNLGKEWMESSPSERDLWVLVDSSSI